MDAHQEKFQDCWARECDVSAGYGEEEQGDNHMIEEEWKAYVTSLAVEKMKAHFDGSAMKIFYMTLEGKETSEIAQTLNLKEILRVSSDFSVYFQLN